jgi:hypothetical protein
MEPFCHYRLGDPDGIDPNSPQLKAKAVQCEDVLPAGTGLPKATVSS